MSRQAKRNRLVTGPPEQTQATSPNAQAARSHTEEPLSNADKSQRRQQLYRRKLRELEERLSRLRSDDEGS
jgi:hypothetical protein